MTEPDAEAGALKALAKEALKAGDYRKAVEALDKALALAPEDPELYELRATAYRFRRDLSLKERESMVLRDLKSAVDKGLLSFSPVLLRATSLMFHWLYEDQAKDKVAEVLAMPAGGRAAVHYHKACFLDRFKNDPQESLRELDRSIACQPSWQAHLLRGSLLKKTGRHAEALRDMDACVALSGARPEARLARARARILNGDAAGACEDFEAALNAAPPDSFEPFMEAAQAHLAAGRPAEAVAELARAMSFFKVVPPDILQRSALAKEKARELSGAQGEG